jgi:hypothetical protein
VSAEICGAVSRRMAEASGCAEPTGTSPARLPRWEFESPALRCPRRISEEEK